MLNLEDIHTLDQLRRAVEAFEDCDLKKHAQNTVFADGNPDSGIVLIGEAPGAQEDSVGRPFVGRSGKLLDSMLATIGLDRSSVYITNTVFWRPPDNRTPTLEEIQSCRPFLLKHLSLIKPKVIVLVGGTAVKAVLRHGEPMAKLRRKWLSFQLENGEDVPMMVMFHPAYVLRNPPAKKEACEDLKMLHEFLHS